MRMHSLREALAVLSLEDLQAARGVPRGAAASAQRYAMCAGADALPRCTMRLTTTITPTTVSYTHLTLPTNREV